MLSLGSISEEFTPFAPLEEPKSLSHLQCEAIRHLSRAVREHREPTSLLAAIEGKLREVIEFDAIVIAKTDALKNSVIFAEVAGDKTVDLAKSIAYRDSFTEGVLKNGVPILIHDADADGRFGTSMDRMRSFQMRSACILPLSTAHRNIGSFSLACKRSGAYTSEHVRFLSFVADQMAMALDDAIHSLELKAAQADLERRNQRLRLLLSLSHTFGSNIDLDNLLQAVSLNLRSAVDCDGASVALPDKTTGQLHFRAIDYRISDRSVHEGSLVPENIQAIYEERKPVNSCFAEMGVNIPYNGFQAACHVPLARGTNGLGLISVARERAEPFTDDDAEFLATVAQQVAVALENSLAYEEIKSLKDRLALENVYLQDEIRSESNFDEIIGQSESLRDVLRQVEVVAPTDSTVLICGDTGTGKELIARAIHSLSSRAESPFVKLNCAAIPTGLLESELFGHERGAFTGAIAQRIGRFEIANRGTVFLDEIGEIPLELQPKLLRVLQEREFERLGSSRTITTQARLIAATNRDLAQYVEQGKFRADLFYRLNVFPLQMPRLNQRKDDIPMLVRHFVRNLSCKVNKVIDKIPAATMDALVKYHWPGNIRELQNVLERAVILSSGPVLHVRTSDLSSVSAPTSSGELETLEQAERKHILNVLKQTGWTVGGPSGAAAVLGLKRTTLHTRMQRLGIRRPSESV